MIDIPLRLFRRPARLVEVELADHALDQAQLVVAVEDLEALRQAGFLVMQAQHAMREAVEGADPHRRGGNAEQRLDAPAHLARRLVGEGHREHRERRQAADLADPGDAVGEHAGLAAAGAGEHQDRAGLGADRLALALVQRIDEM